MAGAVAVSEELVLKSWQEELGGLHDVTLYYFLLSKQIVASGQGSVSQEIRLTPNAQIASYPARVKAGVALWAPAQAVADVRAQSAQRQIFVDFGLPRTVNGVALLDDAASIQYVYQWSGADFARSAALTEQVAVTGGGSMREFSEIRSERLRVTLSAWPSTDPLPKLVLGLPEEPSNFELRINGNRVWSFAGPVVIGEGRWSAPTGGGLPEIEVDLAPALNALAADPLVNANPTIEGEQERFQVTLSASVPGALALELPIAGRDVAYLHRVLAGFSDGKQVLTVEEEGPREIRLAVPVWASRVEAVAFTLSGKLTPSRIVPALGPEALDLAELVVEATRGACTELRPDPEGQVAELEAARLHVRAEGADAELRVTLLAAGAQPGAPLPGGASEPLILQPNEAASWVTFAFPKPVDLTKSGAPWAALSASRGRAIWSLSSGTTLGKTRRGALSGPWFILPQVGELAHARAMLRKVGKASAQAPIAAFECRVLAGAGSSGALPVTPTEKGVRSEIRGFSAPLAVESDSDGKFVRLSLVARAKGTFTLTNVDLTLRP